MQCAYCSTHLGPFVRDHVVPRSRGGPDSPRNIVNACQPCNTAKADKLPSEWLERVPMDVSLIELRITRAIEASFRSRDKGSAKVIASKEFDAAVRRIVREELAKWHEERSA